MDGQVGLTDLVQHGGKGHLRSDDRLFLGDIWAIQIAKSPCDIFNVFIIIIK